MRFAYGRAPRTLRRDIGNPGEWLRIGARSFRGLRESGWTIAITSHASYTRGNSDVDRHQRPDLVQQCCPHESAYGYGLDV